MEVGVLGLNGVDVVLMERLKGWEAATILPLYMGLPVRERTTRKRTVVRLIYLINRINPHQTDVSESLIRRGGGKYAPQRKWPILAIFLHSMQQKWDQVTQPIYKGPCLVYWRAMAGSIEGPRRVLDPMRVNICLPWVTWSYFCCIECKNVSDISRAMLGVL